MLRSHVMTTPQSSISLFLRETESNKSWATKGLSFWLQKVRAVQTYPSVSRSVGRDRCTTPSSLDVLPGLPSPLSVALSAHSDFIIPWQLPQFSLGPFFVSTSEVGVSFGRRDQTFRTSKGAKRDRICIGFFVSCLFFFFFSCSFFFVSFRVTPVLFTPNMRLQRRGGRMRRRGKRADKRGCRVRVSRWGFSLSF